MSFNVVSFAFKLGQVFRIESINLIPDFGLFVGLGEYEIRSLHLGSVVLKRRHQADFLEKNSAAAS